MQVAQHQVPLHSNLLFNDGFLVTLDLLSILCLILLDILHLQLLDLSDIVDFVVFGGFNLHVIVNVLDLLGPDLRHESLP